MVAQGETGNQVRTEKRCSTITAGNYIDLPNAQNYLGTLWVRESGAFIFTQFDVRQDGTVTLDTRKQGNVDNSGGVGYISITDAGTNARITNNFGVSKEVCYSIEY